MKKSALARLDEAVLSIAAVGSPRFRAYRRALRALLKERADAAVSEAQGWVEETGARIERTPRRALTDMIRAAVLKGKR